MKDARLKLRAVDAEDLAIISAVLQDAALPVSEMRYLRDERRFALAASRFRWEQEAVAEADAFERVNCGLVFDRVGAVRTRSLDLADRSQVLDLLALQPGEGAVTLVFGGGAEVRLEVDRIVCHLEDLGAPWPTQWRPNHAERNDD